MGPSVKALEARAEGAANASSDAETKTWVEKWSRLNIHRAVFVATSALVAAVASIA
jgi:anti-sigma-K factor RskA